MIALLLAALLLTGGCKTPAVAPEPAPAPVPAPSLDPPKRAEVAVVKPPPAPDPGPGERVKRITAARADLKTGLTSLELRGVTACADKTSEACGELSRLTAEARMLDGRLAAALLNPALDIDWTAVTGVLREIVDKAMKKEDPKP